MQTVHLVSENQCAVNSHILRRSAVHIIATFMLTDSSKYDYDDVDEEDDRNNDEAMI